MTIAHNGKVLCPVDLSDQSLDAIELATLIAAKQKMSIHFVYIAPQWLPKDSLTESEYNAAVIEEDKAAFNKLRPSDPAVAYEHTFIDGNPGPEIVKAAQSCELVVMATSGRRGLARILMGSVAQYVLRNAGCPVILFRNKDARLRDKDAGLRNKDDRQKTALAKQPKGTYVTEVMHHVCPIRVFDKMEDVLAELEAAGETGAPVVDARGNCVGILTRTDIDRYLELKSRFEKRDESVVDEIFETDKYGQRRSGNYDFDDVKRQMTSPVVTISNDQHVESAEKMFSENPGIHHLVVMDDKDRPLGILESAGAKTAETSGASRE